MMFVLVALKENLPLTSAHVAYCTWSKGQDVIKSTLILFWKWAVITSSDWVSLVYATATYPGWIPRWVFFSTCWKAGSAHQLPPACLTDVVRKWLMSGSHWVHTSLSSNVVVVFSFLQVLLPGCYLLFPSPSPKQSPFSFDKPSLLFQIMELSRKCSRLSISPLEAACWRRSSCSHCGRGSRSAACWSCTVAASFMWASGTRSSRSHSRDAATTRAGSEYITNKVH